MFVRVRKGYQKVKTVRENESSDKKALRYFQFC